MPPKSAQMPQNSAEMHQDSNLNTLEWHDVTVTVSNKGQSRVLLDHVGGEIASGKLMALMGPSGSGKTTLLNYLAGRNYGNTKNEGTIAYNKSLISSKSLQQVSRFIEQEDKLIGSLTVFETVDFAAKLSGNYGNASARKDKVHDVLHELGLTKQKDTIVGTPLRKGISGGQKRRLSIACELVTQPAILFLDEPTSGLDSKASYEVISTLKNIAQTDNVIVIASIHQPSSSTYRLFDTVTYLTGGRTVFSGPISEVEPYFTNAGYFFQPHQNTSEFILDVINTDFSDEGSMISQVEELCSRWSAREKTPAESFSTAKVYEPKSTTKCLPCYHTMLLVHRSLIKSSRDFLAYYVRIVMYLGLAIMMGTVWLRLGKAQDNIQPFINAIFFSGAFMSFMSVAYIPAYIEDYQSYRREKMNGLYGALPFAVSNFIVSLPFLFVTTVLFGVVTYFLVNFRNSADGFFKYVMWLFLDLLAAESMTVLIATVFPHFVIALALTAFANGLWMSVGGFLVSPKVLNVFWYYTFYWINYQRYVFQGMMFNQFEQSVYSCGRGCQCMYASELQDQCQIAGSAVLEALGYGKADIGLWIGLTIVIIAVMRVLAYVALKAKR